jgi:serine protease inhibitor
MLRSGRLSLLVGAVLGAALGAGVVAGMVGCAGGSGTSPDSPPANDAGAALTALPRALSAPERTVLDAANNFSFSLWGQLVKAQHDSNVFVSPLSASFSLGMTMNGAAGSTLDEMRRTLAFGSAPMADVDAGYKSLIGLLTTLDPSTTMQIANSIWYRNTFTFNQSFLNAGSSYFDATIDPLNFDDTKASIATINGWVNDKTHGKIPSIVDEIKPENVMFLINAIYFKGAWRSRFDPAKTQSSTFHSVSGDQPAKLMHKDNEHIAYAQTNAYQAVDLPYGDSAFTMTVVLPKPGNDIDAVAASLTADGWRQLTTGLHTGLVTLDLPKLTLSWSRSLIPDLQTLGMRRAFVRGGADFSGMSPDGHDLFISTVRQKTFVDINEEGTEAAAVTSTGVSVVSLPVAQIVRVDRPFIFAIRERLSGTILFMGKIVRLPE